VSFVGKGKIFERRLFFVDSTLEADRIYGRYKGFGKKE